VRKAPLSKAWWIWLFLSIFVYLALFAVYAPARNNPNLGAADEPFLLIGVCAFILLLTTAAFSLRRRFARGLPGKAQDWLWMHTWVALLTLLVSLLHENYDHITHAEPLDLLHCASDSHFGVIGLYGLILLVLSGLVGRGLDVWQAQIIARDARANGVGIVESLKKQIIELEYVVERLSAGKSLPFKQYCMLAITTPGVQPGPPPFVSPAEQRDFQQACQTLHDRSHLAQSLHRQEQARRIMRLWRTVHIALGCFVLVVIVYHVSMELLSHVLTLLPAQVNTCS
jgi:heme/copper-type cytochrome/quinol oxidase subunit 3